MEEIPRDNEMRPWVYWDVEVIDDTGDEDILVQRHEHVTAHFDSAGRRVTLKDVNDDTVVTFIGNATDEDKELREAHAVVGCQGVDVLNVTTSEGRSVTLALRPQGR